MRESKGEEDGVKRRTQIRDHQAQSHQHANIEHTNIRTSEHDYDRQRTQRHEPTNQEHNEHNEHEHTNTRRNHTTMFLQFP